jgi:ATP-dependent DNA helicase RecG
MMGPGPMDEHALRNFLLAPHPKENEAREWKAFKNLKHAVTGSAGNDLANDVSAVANMSGGHLVIGVEDAILKIVGIEDKYSFTTDSIKAWIVHFCANINSEEFRVTSYIATGA